ncbi:MAG: enoyl-CoA hydratase-related protein [Deferrisomatales bacterium]|nr:enoyl-CoA hydratase-related protein [Deferrisomatales bacterium]
MGGFETIIFAKEGAVGRLTLNRPEALNSFNVRMRDELFEILGAIGQDDEIRVVVVNGAGEKAFCAGADLSEFLTAASPNAARVIRFERDVWARLLELPQPLIAAVHGFVLGSGIEIALCCDIRIASEDAKFGLPELGLGILPAAGGTQTLPRIVGRGAALEMLLTNRRLDAAEAQRIQLVHRVVPRTALLDTALEMAEHIAALDPRAVQYAKQAIVRGLDMSLEKGLELERRLAAMVRSRTPSEPESPPPMETR